MPDGKCDLPLKHPSLGFSFPVECLSGHGTIVGFSFAVMSVCTLAAFIGYIVKEYTQTLCSHFFIVHLFLFGFPNFFFLLLVFISSMCSCCHDSERCSFSHLSGEHLSASRTVTVYKENI